MLRKYLVFSLVLTFVAISCSDEVAGPVLNIGASPEFTAPSANASYILKEADVAKSFATFSWTAGMLNIREAPMIISPTSFFREKDYLVNDLFRVKSSWMLIDLD